MMSQWMPLTNALVKSFRQVKPAASAFAHEIVCFKCAQLRPIHCGNKYAIVIPAENEALVYAAKFLRLYGKNVALCRIIVDSQAGQLSVLDRGVRVFEREIGDLVLITAGKVHLRKCLKDLSDFGQTNIYVSESNVLSLNSEVVDLFSQSHHASADILLDVAENCRQIFSKMNFSVN
uniref:Uncharacterized protein n=1 Tax=Ditylenchus dipsaci TaxID=166011 RepID=A0A915E4L1_9BILA